MTTCREYGRRYTRNSWAIGDLWRFGQKWGEHKALTEDPGWEGPEYQTCANLAWVAGKIEPSRRREDLPFRHHAEVAALPEAEGDELLQLCIDTRMTVADLRREIARRHPERRSSMTTVAKPIEVSNGSRTALVEFLNEAPPPVRSNPSIVRKLAQMRMRGQDSSTDLGNAVQLQFAAPTRLAIPGPPPAHREHDSTADLHNTVRLLSAAAKRLSIPRPLPAQREQPSTAGNRSDSFELGQPRAGVLHLLARESRRREPDSLFTVVIGALEHAVTTAQSSEDRERFRDALSAAREVHQLLFAMIRATPIGRF
jgi:hypothetical protein